MARRSPDPAPDDDPMVAFPVSRMRSSLVNRIRSIVFHTSHLPGEAGTITEFAARALDREASRVEKRHNGGDPFPPVRGQLPTGPRPGTGMGGRPRKPPDSDQ